MPNPSWKPPLAPPAIVLTAPTGVITRRLDWSVTMMSPFPAKARCMGLVKDARVPVPSTHELFPLPANVRVVPLGAITLMR